MRDCGLSLRRKNALWSKIITQHPTAEEALESKPPARRRAMRYLAAYWLFLVVLTHWPNPWPNQGEPKHLDKLVHFTLYGVLAGLAAGALTRRGSHANLRPMLGVLLLAVVFGLVDETTQPYTGRDFDWWDWLADGLGAVTGLLLLSAWRRCRSC